jgi:hypothetical protein
MGRDELVNTPSGSWGYFQILPTRGSLRLFQIPPAGAGGSFNSSPPVEGMDGMLKGEVGSETSPSFRCGVFSNKMVSLSLGWT